MALYKWKLLRPDQPPLDVLGPCGETRAETWWPIHVSANTMIKADTEGDTVAGVAPHARTLGCTDDVMIMDDDVVYRVTLKTGENPGWFDYVMISDGADGTVAVLAAPAAPGTNYACGVVVDYDPASGGICHIVPLTWMLNASETTAQS